MGKFHELAKSIQLINVAYDDNSTKFTICILNWENSTNSSACPRSFLTEHISQNIEGHENAQQLHGLATFVKNRLQIKEMGFFSMLNLLFKSMCMIQM